MRTIRGRNRLVFLTFVAGLASVSIIACVTVSDAGGKVRLVTNANDARGCKLLGHLTAKSGWGNPGAAAAGRKNVEASLQNQTAALDGDTVYVARVDVGEGTTSGEGDAYRCEQAKP